MSDIDLSFINKYPYTDFHELNIDWLLSTYKELLADYTSIVEWMENDAKNYNDLLNRIIALEISTSGFQGQIDTLRLYIDARDNVLSQAISDQYTRITTEYEALYGSILTAFSGDIAALNIKLENYKIELTNLINQGDSDVMDWVRMTLDNFIQDLPDYEHLIVHNPVTGEDTTVQQALDDLYSYFNLYGLTAAEYDALELTAAEYDGYFISAYDYDTMAGMIFGRSSPYLMRSPFTGQMEPLQNVILELYSLHRTGALTATAYDALDLTATAYDALDLEALDYDLNGI